MTSVLAIMGDLRSKGIRADFFTREGSDVVISRNVLATDFLRTDATHLLFIDSDMVLPSNFASDMLAYNKPLIGAIYPGRSINWIAVESALSKGAPLRDALLCGHTWLVNFTTGTDEDQPIRRVDSMGLGGTLIHRMVFERIVAAKSLQNEQGQSAADFIQFYNFFGSSGEVHAGDDMAFFQRWAECGGEAWAFLDASTTHIGDFGYGGRSYLDYARAMKFVTT